MGKLDGKVAFVTGAARGQGRKHAVRLAQEGADIVALDICEQISSVGYPMAVPADLEETVAAVEALDRRIVAVQADVRDEVAVKSAYDTGVATLGPVDIVVANAGIMTMAVDELPGAWQDVVDVNLTGVFHTVEVAIHDMAARGEGGSIVIISSVGGLAALGGVSRGALAYSAAKHGLVGLMHSYANTYSRDFIRVNSVHPTAVSTPMIMNQVIADIAAQSTSDLSVNAMPVGSIKSIDVANAVAWLVSDEARYVTGVALPVDAGFMVRRF